MNRAETLADTVTVTIPRCVAFLAVAMTEKLKEPQNAIKPHWNEHTFDYLTIRLEQECRELEELMVSQESGVSLFPGMEKEFIKESADVANFLMMLCTSVFSIDAWEPPAGYARKPFDLSPSEIAEALLENKIKELTNRTNVLTPEQEKLARGFMDKSPTLEEFFFPSHDGHGGSGC
jgi:hypothetical protein